MTYLLFTFTSTLQCIQSCLTTSHHLHCHPPSRPPPSLCSSRTGLPTSVPASLLSSIHAATTETLWPSDHFPLLLQTMQRLPVPIRDENQSPRPTRHHRSVCPPSVLALNFSNLTRPSPFAHCSASRAGGESLDTPP